jgi:hypothetical protein
VLGATSGQMPATWAFERLALAVPGSRTRADAGQRGSAGVSARCRGLSVSVQTAGAVTQRSGSSSAKRSVTNSGRRPSTSRSYANKSWPWRRYVDMKLKSTAAVWPPFSHLGKTQFLRSLRITYNQIIYLGICNDQANPRAAVLHRILAGAKRHRLESWVNLRDVILQVSVNPNPEFLKPGFQIAGLWPTCAEPARRRPSSSYSRASETNTHAQSAMRRPRITAQ